MNPARRPPPAARPWLLRASLAANLVLLVTFAAVARHRPAPPPEPPPSSAGARAAGAAAPTEAPPSTDVPATVQTNWIRFTWVQFAHPDPKEYGRRLREAAFPEPVVRDIITSVLETRFAARGPELTAETNYWVTGAERRAYNEASAAARRESDAERTRVYRETLGTPPPEDSEAPRLEVEVEDLALVIMFGGLPQPARDQAVALYQEMRGLARELDDARVRPELEREVDEFKRRHAEWARRLQGLVGGSERAEAGYRVGSVFLFAEDEVREALAAVEPTPAELRELSEAVVAGDDPFRWEFGDELDLDEWEPDEDILLNAAEPGFREVLGGARYAVYDRARTRFYRDLREQEKEGTLPAGTAEAAYATARALRDEVFTRIHDPALADEQRQAARPAVEQLCADARNAFTAALLALPEADRAKLVEAWIGRATEEPKETRR
ncbi:MAG: hypothetical protein ACKVYV_02320 [Limisphaerales bacterium]